MFAVNGLFAHERNCYRLQRIWIATQNDLNTDMYLTSIYIIFDQTEFAESFLSVPHNIISFRSDCSRTWYLIYLACFRSTAYFWVLSRQHLHITNRKLWIWTSLIIRASFGLAGILLVSWCAYSTVITFLQ